MEITIKGTILSFGKKEYTSKKDGTKKSFNELLLLNPSPTSVRDAALSFYVREDVAAKFVNWKQYANKVVIILGLLSTYGGQLKVDVLDFKLAS